MAGPLAFSLGTRDYFVVLPFALALPAGWELAAVVIVVQSLVELIGMVFFLRWVPRPQFPSAGSTISRQGNARAKHPRGAGSTNAAREA